jgi:hypothetical protein
MPFAACDSDQLLLPENNQPITVGFLIDQGSYNFVLRSHGGAYFLPESFCQDRNHIKDLS